MKITKNLLPIAFLFIVAAAHSQNTTVYNYSASGGYAPNGNLMNYADTVTGTWSMQYDNLNRLWTAAASSGYYQGLNLQWGYDSFGNRTSQTPSGSNVALPPAISASYNGNNQIRTTTVPGVDSTSYDGAGNQIFDGINAIAYDAENRVCAELNSVTGVVTQYLYDAEGQRVAKAHPSGSSSLVCPTGRADVSITETYVLGLGGEQVTQLNGSGTWQHTNIYADTQLLATYDQEGTQQLLHFNIADALGSKRIQTDYSGAVELSSKSLPFGDGLIVDGNGMDATQHHFTGKERDAESGLDYFGARYYASSMGRFSSPDPSGLYFADPTNPQSLNLYSYARNNPLIGTDPTGMAYCQWDDGTHDDSANTGVEGAVNSGTDCTNAGGTWSHNDGLNDDGSQMGSEDKPSLTVTSTLVTDTDTTSVSTTGPSYDPDAANLYNLVQGVADDTASMPWICNATLTARVQIPKTPVRVGGSLDKRGLHFSGSARLNPGGGPAVDYTTKDASNGVQVSAPIPGFPPFRGTFARQQGGQQASLGVSANIPKTKDLVSVSGSLTFGFLGDSGCRR